MRTLTPREEKVLRMRFGIGENSDHTLEEVGKFFDLAAEFDATDLSTLRQKLQRADSFHDIATEAGDLFSRLNTLTNLTQ